MSNTPWTPEREAEAEARDKLMRAPVGRAPMSEVEVAEIRSMMMEAAMNDLPDAIRNGQWLREELIGAWPHREYRCPCSDKQRDRDQAPRAVAGMHVRAQ